LKRKELKGLLPLMPFPVNRSQELDIEGLKRNVETYEELDFDGYIAFGCMGESYAPDFEEFKRFVDTAVGSTKRLTCVFGVTSHNTKDCIIKAKYAENAGADGIMVGLPYLIPCDREAALKHFELVSNAIDGISIMIYNNPFSFRFNIDSEFWDRLLEIPLIRAVKESNGNVAHRTMVISHISKRVNVFSGAEKWFLYDSLVGANSMVSTAGLGVPRASRVFFDACLRRDLNKALPLHIAFTSIGKEMNSENEVAWLKACAEFRGLHAGPPRYPYLPLDDGIRGRLYSGLLEIKELVGK